MNNERKQAIKILKKARSLLSKGWTQKHAARNKYGHRVDYLSPTATKFCAFGALDRAFLNSLKPSGATSTDYNAKDISDIALQEEAYVRTACRSYIDFNDRQPSGPIGKKNVVDLFSSAIKRLEKRGA
jgi:hypothetical protein